MTSSPSGSGISRRRFALLTGGTAAVELVGTASAASATTGSGGDEVPHLVRLWAQAGNTGDTSSMASLFTEDGTYTDRASFTGRDAMAQWVAITLDSITDARATVLDASRRGDRAAARWTFSGTFTTVDPFVLGNSGVDPQGRPFSVPAVSYFELSGGRIRVVEDVYNLADLMRQFGSTLPYTPALA